MELVNTEEGRTEQFPIGMRVLAVVNNPTYLRTLEELLLGCKYHVTKTTESKKALEMLRENSNMFDLVITDVGMPDIDGFELLEIGRAMDLPVIKECLTRENVASHLQKYRLFMKRPTEAPQLNMAHPTEHHHHSTPLPSVENVNLFQPTSSPPEILQFYRNNSSTYMGYFKIIKDQAIGSSSLDSSMSLNISSYTKNIDPSHQQLLPSSDSHLIPSVSRTCKKHRVTWTPELHQKFLNAYEQLDGGNKAFPKQILTLMNVKGLTRNNVASHLQKYRLVCGHRDPTRIYHHTPLPRVENVNNLYQPTSSPLEPFEFPKTKSNSSAYMGDFKGIKNPEIGGSSALDSSMSLNSFQTACKFQNIVPKLTKTDQSTGSCIIQILTEPYYGKAAQRRRFFFPLLLAAAFSLSIYLWFFVNL